MPFPNLLDSQVNETVRRPRTGYIKSDLRHNTRLPTNETSGKSSTAKTLSGVYRYTRSEDVLENLLSKSEHCRFSEGPFTDLPNEPYKSSIIVL